MERRFRILLGDLPVGALVVAADGVCRWWWEDSWRTAEDRPVVSLNLLGQRLIGQRRADRLPPFLSNLLPEPHSALRRRLARTHGIAEADEGSWLALLGGDLSGGLRVLPDEDSPEPARVRVTSSDAPLVGYRASLGGMQLKFSANIRDRVTLPARGETGQWILKIPPPDKPLLPALEAASLTWARTLGFEVPEARLIPSGLIDGLPADILDAIPTCLAVRRFDRQPDGTRSHMEELCSAMGYHPEEKYPSDSNLKTQTRPTTHTLMAVARVIGRFAGQNGLLTFMQRVVFDALAGNGDAHLKNWALVFLDGRQASMAPVYDVVPTVLVQGDDTLALPLFGHELLRLNRFTSITPTSIREMAKKLHLNPNDMEEQARDLVRRATGTFDDAVAPFQVGHEQQRWREHLREVARAWG